MLFKKLSISLVISISLIFSVINVYAEQLYIGGDSIGIKLEYNGVLITGTYNITIDNKSYNPTSSGYKNGQIITHVNNHRVKNINDLMNEIETNTKLSKKITLTLLDNNISYCKVLHLQNINNQFSTGLYVCDGITGIGTITYYNPQTKRFGALGHIMGDSKLLVNIQNTSGNIYVSKVTSIIKSKVKMPGEKIAEFTDIKIGEITLNNQYGLYGDYDNYKVNDKSLIQTAKISEIKKGKAYFYTVINDQKIEKFEIEIIELKKQTKSDVKGITFKVTDQKILDKTNGIIQGMSGSPIIQNNKIIGCITHVDTNNPNIGYGLYIEWMLENDK